MEYRELGTSGLRVSAIAFGTWGLGGGSVWQDTPPDSQVKRLLDVAADCGINYIDTAPVYGMGTSEELLGKALRGRRDKFVLQTKCSLNWRPDDGVYKYSRDGYTVYNNTGARAVKRDVEESLRRLQTDYLDVLVVHYVNDAWSVGETMDAMSDLLREGKIRAVGISNSTPADLDAYAREGEVALVQEQFSILAPFHGRDFFPACRRHRALFQGYGILEEGYLTGPEHLDVSFGAGDIRMRLPWATEPYKSGIRRLYQEVWSPMCEKYRCSYANLFEAWTLAQFENSTLLTGFRREASIRDTVKCLDLSLDAQDLAALDETASAVQVRTLDK
ncbi:MAG: aldo/keto reductase [Eggerthellaceae bacterium]|jgi:methylglyoxal reductase